LKTVVEAAELLCDEDNVRITLFGSGVMESWIRLQIEQRRLGNLVLGGRVPPEAMASIYSQSSAVLLTLVADEMLSKTIPSKLQSYLGAGVPIIAAAIGEPARIVKESGGGIVCAPECPAALASAIRQLRASSRQEMDAMRRRGQIYYNTHFEPRFLAARLLEQLTQLVNDRKRRGH
jgi:glycosyltransferase involved in cell wall biosynthesis